MKELATLFASIIALSGERDAGLPRWFLGNRSSIIASPTSKASSHFNRRLTESRAPETFIRVIARVAKFLPRLIAFHEAQRGQLYSNKFMICQNGRETKEATHDPAGVSPVDRLFTRRLILPAGRRQHVSRRAPPRRRFTACDHG